MQEQKAKVTYAEGKEVFFFDHSFNTALQHAEKFAKRMVKLGLTNVKLFTKNTGSFGAKWLLTDFK